MNTDPDVAVDRTGIPPCFIREITSRGSSQ